jgi:hypothetical protein
VADVGELVEKKGQAKGLNTRRIQKQSVASKVLFRLCEERRKERKKSER